MSIIATHFLIVKVLFLLRIYIRKPKCYLIKKLNCNGITSPVNNINIFFSFFFSLQLYCTKTHKLYKNYVLTKFFYFIFRVTQRTRGIDKKSVFKHRPPPLFTGGILFGPFCRAIRCF